MTNVLELHFFWDGGTIFKLNANRKSTAISLLSSAAGAQQAPSLLFKLHYVSN